MLNLPDIALSQPAPSLTASHAQAGRTPAAADKAAKEFEGVFIATLMEAMFAGVETDGPFGGGHSEGVYRSLMVQEYGKAVAQSGGIGVASAVRDQMLMMQGE